jgi:DedD protein
LIRFVDRSLKERLAGAVVLVLLAVWLIPQVLDGPDEPGQRATQSLTLPAPANETGIRTETVRLDDKKVAPARSEVTQPAVKTPAATKPAAVPASKAVEKPAATAALQTPATPAEKPAVSPKKAPPLPAQPATSPVDGWFVQLGSFAEQANASRLADRIGELGFKAEVSRYQAGSTVLHRVRVGPRATRVAAEALASDLARRGYPGQVVQDG